MLSSATHPSEYRNHAPCAAFILNDIARERTELATEPAKEHAELAEIYVERGLDGGLAQEVARQLMVKDALAAHVRDELGLSDIASASPLQAAVYSARSQPTPAAPIFSRASLA